MLLEINSSIVDQVDQYTSITTMSSPPNSASSRFAAASVAASAGGQNNNGNGNGNGCAALQRRGGVNPLLQRIQRMSEATDELTRRREEEQERWNAENAAWNANHDRRVAEAEREKAEAEEQARLDAQAKARREQERDDKIGGLLEWMAELQLETKALRAKVERLEGGLAEVRGDAGDAGGAGGAGGGGDGDDREE